MQAREEKALLDNLRRVSARISVDYLRNGKAHLQAMVAAAQAENGLAYCAVVSPDGEILAHSSPEKVGTTYVEPAAEYRDFGEVQRLRYADRQSLVEIVEYRTALGKGRGEFASLHCAMCHPTLLALFGFEAWNLPLVFVGPMVSIGLGILVLARTVRPVSDIEAELGRAAVAVCPGEIELKKVERSGPAALGWNRLVEAHQEARQRSSLEERVRAAMEPLVARRGFDVLNSLPDGIAVTDHEGHVSFANEPMGAICGVSGNSEWNGKTIQEYLRLDAEQAAADFLAPATKNRAVIVSIDQSVDGVPRALRVARHPLWDQDGGARGHVWSVRDVTQQQLAAQMRDQFLQTATHELRTPLANIKAYAETLSLADRLEVEKQKEFCNTINSEATRLARLIDDLLNVSSMEVGSLLLTRQEADVGRLLTEVVGKVKPQMDQKQITFETAFPEKWPKIHLDKDKVATSLVNVLGNAAKYTPAGGRVGLRVTVEHNKIVVVVKDTGIGISPHELPRVFEKFFRSADPRVRQETGSGIGLSLVKEVIRMHGGSIDVRSELNIGTECTITLPLL